MLRDKDPPTKAVAGSKKMEDVGATSQEAGVVISRLEVVDNPNQLEWPAYTRT